MNKDIDYFKISKTGRRPTNEDKALCEVRGSGDADNRVVLAVADGMGGLQAGKIASQIMHDLLEKLYRGGFSGDLRQTADRVETCIQTANQIIYREGQKKKGVLAGTTVSGAVVIGNRYVVFNVGDSRTYIIHAGEIKQITKDHSPDWEAYEAKRIKKEAIGKGVFSNTLTRAVGTKPDVQVDISHKDLKLNKGDILFSCTDGLWNNVMDAEIYNVLNRNHNIKKALETLYKLAYKKGSKDNISIAAYRYGEYEAVTGAVPEKTPEALQPVEKVPKPKIDPQKKREIIKMSLIISGIAFILVAGILIGLIVGTQTPIKKQPIPSPPVPVPIQFQSEVQGGIIKFDPEGGKLFKGSTVALSIKEPLRSSKGDEIYADIYYTLDGSEPKKYNKTKYNGTKYDNPIVIDKDGENILKARLISRIGDYEGKVCHQVYKIQTPIIAVGGRIKFSKRGDEYKEQVKVGLSYNPLKLSNGKIVASDIYYTTDGTEPTKEVGKLYKKGEPIVLKEEGPHTVKARVISKGGKFKGIVYEETFIIESQIIPVTQLEQLDQETQDNIMKKTDGIFIEVAGISKIDTTGKIQIFISRDGKANVISLGFNVTPPGKIKEVKEAINDKLKRFLPPTCQGKPAEGKIWIDFKNILKKKNKVSFWRNEVI